MPKRSALSQRTRHHRMKPHDEPNADPSQSCDKPRRQHRGRSQFGTEHRLGQISFLKRRHKTFQTSDRPLQGFGVCRHLSGKRCELKKNRAAFGAESPNGQRQRIGGCRRVEKPRILRQGSSRTISQKRIRHDSRQRHGKAKILGDSRRKTLKIRQPVRLPEIAFQRDRIHQREAGISRQSLRSPQGAGAAGSGINNASPSRRSPAARARAQSRRPPLNQRLQRLVCRRRPYRSPVRRGIVI